MKKIMNIIAMATTISSNALCVYIFAKYLIKVVKAIPYMIIDNSLNSMYQAIDLAIEAIIVVILVISITVIADIILKVLSISEEEES